VTTLYTIGWERRPLAVFIRLLQRAGVDAIVDVRLRNTSQLSGYAKRDDLAFLLWEGFAIAYEHHPELAPTPDMLDVYREDEDWGAYEAAFAQLLAERNMAAVGRQVLTRYRAPCLLCHEAQPDHCHRRMVAEHWASYIPGLFVVHL